MKEQLPPPIYKRYDKLAFATPQPRWLDNHEKYSSKTNPELLYDWKILNPKTNQSTLYNETDKTFKWKVFSLGKFLNTFWD